VIYFAEFAKFGVLYRNRIINSPARKKGITMGKKRRRSSNKTDTMDATIMFADMVDSSMISHVYDPEYYNDLVSTFQKMCSQVVKQTLRGIQETDVHIEAAVRGDELSLVLACRPIKTRKSDYEDRLRHYTWLALQVAIRLKRRWLLVRENYERIHNGQPPFGIAIGLHAGPVVVGPHTRFTPGSKALSVQQVATAEGYAINIAKRVETASRLGRFSRIYLTQPIYNRTPADFRQAFIRMDVPELKGIPISPVIYEAKGIGHFDDKAFPKGPEFDDDKNLETYKKVVKANPDEVWLLLDLAHKYFDTGEYDKAAANYKSVIESDPDFPPAYAYLGRAHFRNYYFQEAEAALEQATDLDKDQARSNHFFAVCLRRQALFALYKEQAEERAKDLMQKAIHFHDRACRIADLERMDFPWARNGLNCTIAQCADLGDGLSLPYDMDKAFEVSKSLRRRVANSIVWKAKEHLVCHTMGIIKLQQKQYRAALKMFQEAISHLERRNRDTDNAPDPKGYAERKAEILYHTGLCYYAIRSGFDKAVQCWKEGASEIERAWDSEATRAFDGQYWMYRQIRKQRPDGVLCTIRSLVSS